MWKAARDQHVHTSADCRSKSMMWILRLLLTLPALIATGWAHDTLGPVLTVVGVIAITGFAVVATGWTIRRAP